MNDERSSKGGGKERTVAPSSQDFADAFKTPSEREDALVARRRKLGLGVGLDSSGRMATQAQVNADASSASVQTTVMRAFCRIADAWGLTGEERAKLLGIEQSELFQAVLAGDLPMTSDSIERISYCLGIFKAINTLLPVPSRADAWIRRPDSNALFNGMDAISYMLVHGKDGLRAVRRYLDAECN